MLSGRREYWQKRNNHVDVIHFTHGAADPLTGFDSTGVRFLLLADGHGDTQLSCVHLDPGAKIEAPPLTHAATLLVIHGRITITRLVGATNINIYAGMGCVFDEDDSVDLYTGPKPPQGQEANWIPTVAGKGWFPFFRFYGPDDPLLRETWKLPDIEKMK